MTKVEIEVSDNLWQNFKFHAAKKYGTEFSPESSAFVDALKLWLMIERGKEIVELIMSGEEVPSDTKTQLK